MKIKYITEGYFKTPQQLKDKQEKNQRDSGLAIARATRKLIIPKLQPVLNNIIASTCLDISSKGYFYGFKLSSNRSILIGGRYINDFGNTSGVEQTIMKLSNQTDNLVSKIYFDDSDILHFSITLNLTSMQFSTSNNFAIVFRCFKNGSSFMNTNTSMLIDSNGKNKAMAIVKKEIAKSMGLYALSDNKDKDTTIAEILNNYSSAKKIVVDNIFLNFENIDNPIIIITDGPFNNTSYDTESSIEENNKKLVSAFLDIFTFADNVKFRISYRTNKNYADSLSTEIKSVFYSLPTFTGGVEVTGKKFSSAMNKIIVAAAEEMYYGRPNVIKRIGDYFSSITPRLTYVIFTTIYYYDNKSNFINTSNILNNIALQISEQDSDNSNSKAIVKLGLGWTDKGGPTKEGKPFALKSFDAHVYIDAPFTAHDADLVFDVSNYLASDGPLGTTSKNRSQVAEKLYKDIFDYLHDYAVNNGTVVSNILR